MADLSDSPSCGHGQAGSTMEAVSDGEDLEMPGEIGIHVEEFKEEYFELEKMIHRFPASLADIGDQFILPMALAIGPYHRDLPRVQRMEKVKRMAADAFINVSEKSREEMYSGVLAVADQARCLYANASVSGISTNDFTNMMFHDACFLLWYMNFVSHQMDDMFISPLERLFLSNKACIDNDIMLLENQLPWFVIQAMMAQCNMYYMPMFIGKMGNLMSNLSPYDIRDEPEIDLSRAAHLLGNLLLHKQGKLEDVRSCVTRETDRKLSAPVSAMELEGIAIKLHHSNTGKFNDIGISRGQFFDKLSLWPLKLDRVTTSWLTNMVALEVCTAIPNQSTNDGSVCSYVAILAMLIRREEDVHKLRSQGFIQGELTDKQILEYFNRLGQRVTPGGRYFQILGDIQDCRERRWPRIMFCKFISDNAKAIAAVLSIMGVLVGIFKTLFSLKQH